MVNKRFASFSPRGDTERVKSPRWIFLLLLGPLLPLLLLLCDGQHAFLTRDIGLAYLPAKHFWVQSMLSSGAVPAWNPLSFGGTPFRADLNLSPLHPLNFLFLLTPQATDKGYLIFVSAHLLLLSLGCWLLFRRLRFGRDGSFLATLCFSLGGIVVSLQSLVNVLSAFTAWPYFLYFVLGLRKKYSWGESVGLAVALAWPIYAGDPQVAYWMALAAAYLVGVRVWQEKSARPFLRTFSSGLLAIGLSAAQLLPALQLAAGSERGLGGLSLSAAERFSMNPLRLMEFFLPLPFGNPGAGVHWMEKISDAMFTMPFLLHIYPGIVAAGLIAFALLRGVRRRRALFKVGALFFLLLLVLGKYLGLYALFFHFFPGWNLFRYPERLLVLFVFCSFLLAGPAFRWVAQRMRHRPVGASRKSMVLLATVLTMEGVLLFWVYRNAEAVPFRTLAASMVHVSLLGALVLLLSYFRGRKPWVQRHAFLLLCAIVVLDLLPFSYLMTWRTSVAEVRYRENEFAQKIRKHLAGREREVQLGAASRYFHGTFNGPFPTSSEVPLVMGMAWDFGVMVPNVHMMYGLKSPAGYSPFDPPEVLTLWAKYAKRDPDRLLNLFSVAYFAVANDPAPLKFNPKALPEIWLPEKAVYAPVVPEREKIQFDPAFSYQTTAVLEGTEREWAREKEWEITYADRSPDKLKVQLRATSPEAIVVWNEHFNKNWVARWGAEKIPIRKSGSWAMFVKIRKPVDTEKSVLRIYYEDPAIEQGNWITLLTLAGMLIATAGTLCRSGRPRRG